jgi:isopenicillin N synthase-like dioxygenase
MENYFDKCQQITLDLMEALEVAVGIDKGALVGKCQGHASELRLNHYPAIEAYKFDQNIRRIWPHTDFGMITLLAQDEQGGLEVQDPDAPGVLRPVTKGCNTELLVNVGDTLERWTNGVVKAALHQVTMPTNVDSNGTTYIPPRYSVAFFLKATRDTSVGALPHFVTPEHPCRYEDMTALAYQQSRTRAVY